MLAIMPSVVSIPPNSSTAALETTWSRSSPPAAWAAAATSEAAGSRSSAGPIAACSAANPRRPSAVGAPPAVIAVTEATIASYQPSTSPGPASSRPSACVTTIAASGPASARRSSASPGAGERVDEPVRLGRDERGEPLPYRIEPERRREGVAVAPVLEPVEAEHARSHDLRGREARIVDGERLRVAHDLHGQVAPRHQPAVERRNPCDRLARPQPGQHGMRIPIELLERDGGAEGQAGASPSCTPISASRLRRLTATWLRR